MYMYITRRMSVSYMYINNNKQTMKIEILVAHLRIHYCVQVQYSTPDHAHPVILSIYYKGRTI